MIVNGEKTAEEYGIGSGDTYLTNVDCVDDTDDGLLGCDNVQWGSSCQNGLGLAGVVCRRKYTFVACYKGANAHLCLTLLRKSVHLLGYISHHIAGHDSRSRVHTIVLLNISNKVKIHTVSVTVKAVEINFQFYLK